MKVKGAYLILVRDADTLRILKEIRLKNVVTTAFLNLLPQAVYGGKPFRFTRPASPDETIPAAEMRKYWYLVLGTGTGTPSQSDTGLFTPVGATAKHGSISVDGNTVSYYVRYLPEEANGYAYTEIGIYDLITGSWVDNTWVWGGYAAGTLLTHALIEPPITKTIDILLDCYAQITFS